MVKAVLFLFECFYLFSDQVTSSKESREDSVMMKSPLMHIEGFLLALTNPDKDGRIVVAKKSKDQ